MKIAEKLFDARSPFWQLSFALLVITWFSYAAEQGKQSAALSKSGGYSVTSGPLEYFVAFITVVMIVAVFVVTRRHNKRHKHSKVRMSLWFYPPKVVKDDEMMERGSLTAAKRSYVYNNVALPLLVSLVLFYRMFPEGLGVIFALYVAGYYLTYLFSVWRYLGED